MNSNIELEKQAALFDSISKGVKALAKGERTNLGKFFRTTKLKYQKGGAKGALDYMESFKNPQHALRLGKNSKGTVKGDPVRSFGESKGSKIADEDLIQTRPMQNTDPSLSRGIRTSLGNTAANLNILMKDLKGKGLFKGTGQVIKNTGELVGRQIKGDVHKEVSVLGSKAVGQTSGDVLVRKNGKDYIKSKTSWLPDREVQGKTDRGTYLIKKRKAMQPVSVALGVNGLGVAGLSYAASEKKSKAGKAGEAAMEAGLFSVSPPVGMASILLRGDKKKIKQQPNIKKLQQNKEELR